MRSAPGYGPDDKTRLATTVADVIDNDNRKRQTMRRLLRGLRATIVERIDGERISGGRMRGGGETGAATAEYAIVIMATVTRLGQGANPSSLLHGLVQSE